VNHANADAKPHKKQASATYTDGTGTAASFNQLFGVAWSPDGSKVAVADSFNYRVRLIAVATQVVTTLAGSGSGYADGTGTAASFNQPRGVDWSPDGS
jgi:DNA-binding beta-propeller fold protein YncE